MVAHRGRHIDVGIRVMQRMKPPEERHCVLAAVHRITQQVEQQKARRKAQHRIGYRPGREPRAENRLEPQPRQPRRFKEKPDEQQIEKPEADIAEPPPQRRKFPPSARLAEFPQRDEYEAT